MVRIQKLGLLSVLLLVATFANAQELINGLYYQINDKKGTAYVCPVPFSDAPQYSGTIVIPASITWPDDGNNYRVDSIGKSAFEGSTGLTSISIPASVKGIGKDAFKDCSVLQKVIFASVNDLCGITFANGAANPLSNTYAQLYKNSEEALATIEIGNNVSRINAYAFYGIKNITAVYISGNVTSIGNEAFNKCSGFDKVFYADMTHLTTMSYESSTSNPIVYAGEVWLNNGGSQITEITISNDVNSYAFRGFKNLTKVDFAGNNVINIGTDAFYDCKNLSEIYFPSSLKTIGSNAFHNTKLNSIYIPENIISIANEAFTGCTSLENVIIEASLNVLPSRMFDGCTNLKKVTLPKATTTIGNKTFKNCSSLTSLPEGEGLVKFDENSFEGCKGFTELTLPKNIQTIGNYAFKDCTNLTDLFILEPEDETTLTIGSSDWVFSGSKSLKIYSNRTKAPSSSVNPFNGYESIKMYIPEGETTGYNQSPWAALDPKPYEEHTIAYYVDGEEIYSENVEVGQPVPTLEEQPTREGWDFAGWDDEIPSLMPDKDLSINGHFTREYISPSGDDLGVKYFLRSGAGPDTQKAIVIGYNNSGNNSGVVKINSAVEFDEDFYTIDSISTNAFKGAESLTEIDLSNATTKIGIALFEGCSALKEVTLPAALTEIKEKMFYRCSALSTLVLPENVETIGASAFASCTALSTLVLPDKVKTIGASAFEGCTNYNIDHLPSGLQTLGKSAFNSCGIVEMSLPKSITSMGESVFQSCTNLKKVVFNEEMGLSILPAYTFSGCKNLESFTLPTSTTIIGGNAFASCSSLKVLALDNVVEISPNAFSSCDNLKTVSLPTTVKTLGKNAFTYCRNVEMITIESTNPPSVEENTFSDAIYSKAILCVKNADKYKNHDIWKNFENIEPIAASPKLIYKLDGKDYIVVEQKTGSPVEPQANPNRDSNPKGRAFSGWKGEPDIMPNKDSVIVGSLKYQRIYKAEETTDELYSDSLFYGDKISHPVNLKKEGLTDSIINPTDTIRADITLFVNYRLTTAPTGKNNIFNNADQDLINYVNLKEGSGTLKYSLDKEKNYSTEVKGKDAKTYKVYYKVDGVTEHYNTAPDSLDVTIAPRSTSVKSITLSQTSYTYDRKAHEPAVTSVTVNYGDIVIDPKEYKVSYANNINATSKDSKAQVVITDSLGGNFTLNSKTTMFEITPAKGKVDELLKQKPTGLDKLSFTGEAQNLIIEGTVDDEISKDGKLKYSLDNKTFAEAIPQGTKAQVYTVYYKVEDDPNYTPSDTAHFDVTIHAKEIAISAENITLEKESFVYDGTAQKPLVTVKKGETIIPAEEYTVSYTDSINAGDATVTITDKDGGDYKFESASKTYKITPKAGKLEELLATHPQAAGDKILYNTDFQNLIKAGTFKKGITGGFEGVLKYSLDKDNIAFDKAIPQGKDAKDYTVYYMVDGDPNYTASDTLSVPVTIYPRPTSVKSITLSQNSYVYNGQAHEPTITSVTVNYNNLVIDSKEYKFSYANNINATSKDSKAQVVITDSLGGNFTFDSKSTTFEITPAKGKVDELLAIKPVGIDNLAFTGEAQDLISEGTIKEDIFKGQLKYSLDNKDFSTAVPQGTKAQVYTVYYKVEDDPNYTPSDTAYFDVTIKAKEIAISAENITLEKDSYIYNGEAMKPGVTVKIGEITIPAEEYTVSYTDSINVGDATVTVTDKDGGNYKFESASKTYKITPKAGKLEELLATYPQSAGDNIRYNTELQNLIKKGTIKKGTTGSLKYSLDKDNIAFDKAIPQGKDAKEYTVYYMVDGDPNYTASDTLSLSVTIYPRSTSISTISLSQNSYTYDGQAKEPAVTSVTVSYGGIVIDPKEYKVSYANNVNATNKDSKAQVVITDSLGGNFTIDSKTTTFEITPAKGKLDALLTQQPKGFDTLCYNGVAQNLIKAGIINNEISKDGKLKYSLDNKTFADAIPQGTKAQTYKVYYKVEDDPNYTPSDTANFVVTIQTQDIAISADNIILEKDTFTYDGTAQKPLVTAVKIGETTIPAEEYTVSYKDSINAGTATVTVAAKNGGNYDFESASKTYTILQAAGKLSELLATKPQSAGDNIRYNAEPQNLIKAGTIKKGITGTLKYSTDSIAFDTNIPQGTDAKDYTVYYMVDGDPNYTASDTLSVPVTIYPRTASVSFTLKENSYTYDGKAKEPGIESVSVSFNTSAGSKTINIVEDKKEYKVSYANNVNATSKSSKAQVTITDSVGGNFSFAEVSKTFEIAQAKGKLDSLLTQKPVGFDTLCYNGVDQNLIKAGAIKEEKFNGQLKYSLDNKEFSTVIPQGTKAQTYTIYYKVEDDPNYIVSDTLSLNVAIKAKEYVISAENITLEKDTFIYDGTAKKPGVTVKVDKTTIPEEEYIVSYKDSINAGTATVTITEKAGGNYKIGSVSKKYTITPKAGKLEELLATHPQAAGDNIIYNTALQNLIKAGTIKKGISGTLKYSKDKIAFDEAIPQGKDAKDYMVYYKVEGDPNYTTSDMDSVKVTINPKPTKVYSISLSQNSYVYDGTAKKPAVTSVTVNYNNIVLDPKEYKVSYANNINATDKNSKAQVEITDSVGGNFIIESKTTTFEITPAKGKLDNLLTKKPTGIDNLTYTGEDQNLIQAGKIKEEKFNGRLKYSLDNKEFTTAIPQGTKAQDYTVYYKVEDDPNYTPSDTLSLKVTIKAKKLSLSAENLTLEKDSFTYDGSAKKPGVTIKVGKTIIPAEEYTVSYKDSINAGTATVTVAAKNGSNYSFESVSRKYKITPAVGSLEEFLATRPQSAGDNILYNNSAQNLIKAGTVNKGFSCSLKYSLDKKAFGTDIPQGTDAKEYTVYYKAEGDPNYTSSEMDSVKVSILPRTTSVTNISLKETRYTYDGTAKKPAVESVSVSFNNLLINPKEFTVSYQDSINAGTGKVIVTGKKGGNYSFEDAVATFEIAPAKGDLKKLLTQQPTGIDNLSYTGAAQNLVKAGSIKNGISGSLKYSLDNKAFDAAIPQGTAAQDYTVYYKVEDDPNYTPSDTASFKVTIKAKKLSLSAQNIALEKDSYTYDGTAKKPGVTINAGGETIPAEEYLVSYTDSINAGTATVTITAKNGSNYSFATVSKTYKITPAASILTQNPTGKNLTYNGTAQELINNDGKTSTGTLEYSLSQDEKSFKPTIPTGTDAKTYTVYYRVKGDANHSDSEIGLVKTTIAAKEINSFSLAQGSYTYAGSEIEPEVIVEFNGQAVSKNEYTVSYTNNINVGTATVTITDNADGNFTVSGSKTFTISKAPLTISADSYDIFEGDRLPEFTIRYDGFVNNETEAVLTAKPILSCNATATSRPGDYTISVGGAKAENYNIKHVSGKLTIIAMKFVSGGESSKDEDDAATYQITSTGKDAGTTPTVAVVDDKEVGGSFAIPEAVTYHNTNYKVTEIDESAFENNKYLTNVTIPSSITNIGDKAFKGCSNLKSITVYITTPISLAVAGTRGSDGASVFEGVDKLTCVLYVPDGSVDLYKAAPVWCEFKHIVPISTITGISEINLTPGEAFDIYDLQGRKVRSKVFDLKGLPRGVYIIHGKKVAVK